MPSIAIHIARIQLQCVSDIAKLTLEYLAAENSLPIIHASMYLRIPAFIFISRYERG